MNNTFDFKRFALYARKHYWENKLYYLLLIAGAAVAIFLLTTEPTFTPKFSTPHNPITYIEGRFIRAFIFIGILFTIGVLSRSAAGMQGASFKMSSMLLPVSYQERFWFMIINSTIVTIIVFTSIFYAVTLYTESLYLFSDKIYAFKGLLNNGMPNIPAGLTSETFSSENIFSLSKLCPTTEKTVHKVGLYSMFISTYLYSIAVLIWGALTLNRIKRYKFAITILAHMVIIGALIALMAFITKNVMDGVTYNCDGLVIYSNENTIAENILYFTPLLLIFPLVYFFVSWKKLKSLEVYN